MTHYAEIAKRAGWRGDVPEFLMCGISDACVYGALAYVVGGEPLGGFLTAMFANDFVETFAKADATNQLHMKQWAGFLYWHVPRGAWGSYEAVKKWQAAGGAIGLSLELHL